MPKNRTPVVTGLNSDRGTIDWRDEFLSMGTNLQYYLVIRQAYIDKVKALIKEADLEEDEVSGYLKWLKWLNDGPAGLERVLEDMGEDDFNPVELMIMGINIYLETFGPSSTDWSDQLVSPR